MEKIIAQEGKVFKVKNTEYYIGKIVEIGGKLITANGKVLETPITLTRDNIEEVSAKPFIPVELPEDEEDIEEE